MGITVRFADPADPQAFRRATDARTRAYYAETLPNPKLTVFPIGEVAAIGREALKRGTGARGLRAILEEVMLEIMYELPSIQGLKECVITREVIMNHESPVLVSEPKEQTA